MPTAIEQLLYQGKMAHAVVDLKLLKGRLVLAVAPTELVANRPAELLPLSTMALFDGAVVTSIETNDCAEPVVWDIIGFDCRRRAEDRWEFVLHTSAVEFTFESRWPQLLAKPPTEEGARHAPQ